MGNTVKAPPHRVHQTTVPGLVGPQSSHLRDPYRQKVSQSSTNYLSPPQAAGFGSHQVASEASPHPGLPPGYNHLMDTSLQLSNLSTQGLKFVVRGENLDPTATLAIDSGSSKVPRHPLIGQLKIDLGQSEVSTLLSPNRRVKNVWHSGLQHQRRHDPLRFPPQAQHSSGQSGECETYPPATTQPATLQSKMDPLRFASHERVSSARSQSRQNLERPGSTDWSSTNVLKSEVHNVRVKPPSRFVSSANPLRLKLKVEPLNSAPTDSSGQEHVADGGREGKRAQAVALGQTSTHQQMHLHNPVHSNQNQFRPVAGTEYGGWLGSASAPRNFAQAAGKIGDSPVDVQDSLDGGN